MNFLRKSLPNLLPTMHWYILDILTVNNSAIFTILSHTS